MRGRRAVRYVVAVALLSLLAPGCTLSPVEISVAGRDASGTVVVGSVDCSFFGGSGHDSVHAILWSESQEPVEWQIDRRLRGPESEPARGRTPIPTPTALDEVPLIAVGSVNPPGWVTRRAPVREIPTSGTWRITFESDTAPSRTHHIDLPILGPADDYTLTIEGRVQSGLSAQEATERIATRCDEATAFNGGRFAAILGGGGAAMAVAAVVIAVVTARQWRRAGAAAAARVAADRSAGPAPRPWG